MDKRTWWILLHLRSEGDFQIVLLFDQRKGSLIFFLSILIFHSRHSRRAPIPKGDNGQAGQCHQTELRLISNRCLYSNIIKSKGFDTPSVVWIPDYFNAVQK